MDKITYTNLLDKINEYLTSKKIEYTKEKREYEAQATCLIYNEQPEKLFTLIQKMHYLKTTPTLPNDVKRFFAPHKICLRHAYSCRDQIEEYYKTYYKEPIKNTQTNIHSKTDIPDYPKTWTGFIQFLKDKKFTESTIKNFSSFQTGIDYNIENGKITLHRELSSTQKTLIDRFF